MSDNLTATLAEWGEQFEGELNLAVAEETDSLERSLALLAAIEAALKTADHFASEADRFGSLSETADEDSGAALAALAAWQAYDRCARTLREAITRSLVAALDSTSGEQQR